MKETQTEIFELLTNLDLSQKEYCQKMHLALGPSKFSFESNIQGSLFGWKGSTTVSFRDGLMTQVNHWIDTEPKRAYTEMKENLEKAYGVVQAVQPNEEFKGFKGLFWRKGEVGIYLVCFDYKGVMMTSVRFEKVQKTEL